MADNPEWEFLGDVSTDTSNVEPDFGAISIGVEEPEFPIEGDGSCVVCGAPTFRPPGLTKSGYKKRVPKFCEDHNPKKETTTTSSSTASAKSSGLDPSLARVAEELADDIKLLGTLAGVMYPVTGYYLVDNADPFTIALIKLAGKNPAILRVLHRAAQVAPIYTVLETIAGVAVSVQVDMDKIDPHSFASTHTGVERAYNEVYPDGKPMNNRFAGPTAPPHFTTVN